MSNTTPESPEINFNLIFHANTADPLAAAIALRIVLRTVMIDAGILIGIMLVEMMQMVYPLAAFIVAVVAITLGGVAKALRFLKKHRRVEKVTMECAADLRVEGGEILLFDNTTTIFRRGFTVERLPEGEAAFRCTGQFNKKFLTKMKPLLTKERLRLKDITADLVLELHEEKHRELIVSLTKIQEGHR